MKFHVFRCLGVFALGIAAFFLAVFQGTYSWDSFFRYLLRDYINLLLGFIFSLSIASIFLSIEQDGRNKS